MAEKRYPEILKNLSTCKSPQMMMAAVLKKYWADRMGACKGVYPMWESAHNF